MSAPLIAACRLARSRLVWTMTLVLLLAACASPSASPANGEGEGGTITISGSAFIPTSITVAFGEAIEFTNNDGFDHRIVQGENGTEVAGPALEAISLASGDRSSQIRFSPGTYNLTCTIHPSMNMTITVVE